MSLRSQRRLAASILGVGVNRVWIDPERVDEVETAITREEIKRLIDQGVIRAQPLKGQSRGRTRILKAKRRKGRRRGPGSRKGSKYAVVSRKRRWINRIRALRKRLRLLRDRRIITVSTYRMLYRKAKGGMFKSCADLERYIEEHKLRRRILG